MNASYPRPVMAEPSRRPSTANTMVSPAARLIFAHVTREPNDTHQLISTCCLRTTTPPKKSNSSLSHHKLYAWPTPLTSRNVTGK